MTPSVCVSSEPIGEEDLLAIRGSTARPFVVSYVEHVRVPDEPNSVVCYSAFRALAEAAVLEICNEVLCDAPDALEVSVRYRLGALAGGDAVLVVAVGSDRFEDAYGACGRLTARLRASGPVSREALP